MQVIKNFDYASICIIYATLENQQAYQDFLAFRNALIANGHQTKIEEKPNLPFKF